jgi:hypothetical protein
MKRQLPYIQELFSEAFMGLQKDIAMESGKSFHRMMKCANDPLSILTDNAAKIFKKKKVKVGGNQNDGGFLNHVQQKEIDLIEQQKKRVQVDTMITAANESTTNLKQNTAVIVEGANPYKRRKYSTKSSWHLVLDPKRNVEMNVNDPMDGKFSITICTCGSNNVTTLENISSRMNDVSKADIWGYKRDQDEVSSKYQCKNCGKIWNEIE